ncbi:hypothetical protein [uncultured Sphingomonas sp.]|uniref:hypothetical protein n=1 Tax=uncultured Sphingomonas sp. TaxID=158754 RepID=UPI0030FB387D
MSGALAALALIRKHWQLALIAFLAGLCLVYRGERDAARQAHSNEQIERKADHDRADRDRADQERGFAQRQANGISIFADKLAAREPIIVHSTNTVREYAQTDAGRARCLGADRVRGLDAYLSALANPNTDSAPAGSRTEAVPADTDPAPAGR